jgi:DNA-binding transcriptional LysR family regulator
LRDCFSDTLVLVVPRDHPLANAQALAFEDVLDENFIGLADGTALSGRLLASASLSGKQLKVRMQMRSFDGVCRMVAGNLGVAVLPLQAVAPQLASLPIRALPLRDDWCARTHRIALRSEVPPSPATCTLIDALTRQSD